MNRSTTVLSLTGLLGLATCAPESTPAAAASPRPVRVVKLEEEAPLRDLTISGSVRAWKEEDVAFEVDGKVSWIAEESAQLQGRWVENGETVLVGDVLARMDEEPFTIRRDAAAASMRVADKKKSAAILQKEKVLPASKRAAEAEAKRAKAEYDRVKKAHESSAVSTTELDRAEAGRDSAQALVEEAEALMLTQDAEIAALEAQVEEARLKQQQLQFDLDRCTLYAPFSGEVSDVLIEAGGFAGRGKAVAHLVMMDPVRVDIALSDAEARRLHVKQSVSLLLPGRSEPARGVVYQKSTTADPKTRTFLVSLLTRNQREQVLLGEATDTAGLPVVPNFMYLQRASESDPDGPFFVEERRAVFMEGTQAYVWACPDRKLGDEDEAARIRLRKTPVQLGEKRLNYQGLYLFRELTDTGGLAPETLIAMDVPDTVEDGGEVLLAGAEWALRPGQVVDVVLADAPPPAGLWAPMAAVQPLDEGQGAVFVLDGSQVRRVVVALRESVGQRFRLEAASPEGAALLKSGASLVLDHIHFLEDGEEVRVIQNTEQTP